MPRQMRRICSVCDKDLTPKNAAPSDPDVKYIDEPHRGCKAPKEKELVVVARPRTIGMNIVRTGGYDPEKQAQLTEKATPAP